MATVEVDKVQNAPAASASAAEHTGDGSLLETMQKAAKQVEFYFADANLPFDKFMWTLYSKDPEHWIPIQTIASFKRMRDYGAHGVEWVANAIRLSDFLEVDESGTKVRRKTAPQEPKDAHERSVYAKGFGEEDPTLQSKLEEFFGKYGAVNQVRMRRDEKKKFKSSVFTEFRDFESVDAFLKADPKPTWNGEGLIIMTKEDYCQMKIKEKGLSGKAAIHRRDLIANSRGFNAFKQGDTDKSSDAPKEVYLDFLGNKLLIKPDEEGNGTVADEDIPFVRGVTLKFDGCGGDVKWSEIKDPIKERFDGRAPYIKYSRGDNGGLVGFYKPLSEEDINYVKDTIKTINEHEVTWSIPTEEEEKLFEIERAKAAAKNAFSQASSPKDSKRSSGTSRGRGRGARGGRGGRGSSRGGRGRGGRGGARSGRDDRTDKTETAGDEATGEKRKRGVEPDGGPNVGDRATDGPPAIQATKKVKTDSGDAAPSA